MIRPDGLDPYEQERLRVEYFGLYGRPPDPDPLVPTDVSDAYEDGYVAGVAHGVAHDRKRDQLATVALAGAIVVALLLTAFVVGRATAAPRTAHPTAGEPGASDAIGSVRPSAQVEASASGELSGAPLLRADESSSAMEPIDSRRADGGAPLPPDVELGTAIAAGLASWYDDGPGIYAAVPSWSFGDIPYRVQVCRKATCVVVTVRDFCGCPGDRIIDLSPAAFGELAPLTLGLVEVTVEDVGPSLTPPPTGTEP